MIIAIPYDEGQVYQHFGQTSYFKLYHYDENKKLVSEEVLDTKGYSHITLIDWLKRHSVDVLLCGGIGEHGRMACALADIQFICGVKGDCDRQAQDYIDGTLQFDMSITCGGGCHH